MTTIPAEKLDKLVARWQAIQGELASGADAESYAQLSKEFSDLNPIVEIINALRQAQEEYAGLQEILEDRDADADMKLLAEEEVGGLGSKIEDFGHQLKIQLLPKDDADEKSAILEVRAGTGGDEAALFAGDLYPHVSALRGPAWLEGQCHVRERVARRAATRKSSPTSPARACSRG